MYYGIKLMNEKGNGMEGWGLGHKNVGGIIFEKPKTPEKTPKNHEISTNSVASTFQLGIAIVILHVPLS